MFPCRNALPVPMCSNTYGGWFTPCHHHSVRMTYRPSAALRLLGSLRISHNKFLLANKWILLLPYVTDYRISQAMPALRDFFCGFPVHSFIVKQTLMDCTTRCITTPGCRSFNFRPSGNSGGTPTGDCVIIAPVVNGDGTLVMADKGWTLYELVITYFSSYSQNETPEVSGEK